MKKKHLASADVVKWARERLIPCFRTQLLFRVTFHHVKIVLYVSSHQAWRTLSLQTIVILEINFILAGLVLLIT